MPVIFSPHLSKAHRSGTSVNMVIKHPLRAAVTSQASGWQCQAALAAVGFSLLSLVRSSRPL